MKRNIIAVVVALLVGLILSSIANIVFQGTALSLLVTFLIITVATFFLMRTRIKG